MNNKFIPIPQPSVAKLLLWQIIATLLCIIAAVIVNSTWVLSALCGAMISLIPSVYFAYRVFKISGARYAKYIAQSFYKAETAKFLLTMVGFALVFSTYKHVRVDVFFASYLVVMITGLLINFQQTLRK
jgi:ATP synthase protein I